MINKPPLSKGFSQANDSVSIQYPQQATHFRPWSMGVFGVFDIPFIFDVYGSVFYSFGTNNNNFYHGPGVKAGISYLSAILVKFLAELKWGYYMCRSGGPNNPCLEPGFNMADIMLTVNIPLSSSLLFGWFGGGGGFFRYQFHRRLCSRRFV